MAEIELTQGYKTIVDDDIYELLNRQKWWIHKNGGPQIYAKGSDPNDYNKRVYMHRVIANAPKGMHVDHINGNSLDNRKENLRVCTHAENTRNKRITSKYGYKGIYYVNNYRNLSKPWQAAISVKGHPKFLGYYATPEEAARAYDKAAKELYGEYANLNFERNDL
jgi:hypothetical protein